MDQFVSPVSASHTSAKIGYVADLDTPLLMFSEFDVWTLRMAAEGVLITGGIGSGKSSGSGAEIFKSYLRAGFGGLVCCANIDEADRWRRYCSETGRSQSIISVDKSLSERFNFLDYQMAVGNGSTFEAVQVLVGILNAAEGRVTDASSDGNQQFWEQTLREILRKTLAPLWAAYGRITIAELIRFMLHRPTHPDQLWGEAADRWLPGSFWAQTMNKLENDPVHPLDPEDKERTWEYWTKTMLSPDQKTAGNILQTVTARLDPLTTGALRHLFCTTTTAIPEMTFEGALILLDLSAHEWGAEGVLCQHIWKMMWQKAVQRRPKTEDARPCFLAADECQYFLASSDQQFQSTARACRALVVYLTQNLPGVYARIGGADAQNVADALLGNLATKIFHAQPDARTAAWAAEMIGKALVWRETRGENENANIGSGRNSSSSQGGSGPGQSSSGSNTNEGRGWGSNWGASQTIDYRLQPSHFTTLRKGGGDDRMTEAIIFQAGRVFHHTGSTWTPALFRQS